GGQCSLVRDRHVHRDIGVRGRASAVAAAGGHAVRCRSRTLWRHHGGEPGAGHGDATLRREPIRSVHGGADIARASRSQPHPLCIGDIWLPDHHHLRAGRLAVPEATGVRLSTCPAAAVHVVASCRLRCFRTAGRRRSPASRWRALPPLSQPSLPLTLRRFSSPWQRSFWPLSWRPLPPSRFLPPSCLPSSPLFSYRAFQAAVRTRSRSCRLFASPETL